MAQTLAAAFRFAEALDHLDRAEAIDPGWHRVHLIRGDVLVAMRKEDEAILSYRRAISLAPQKIEAMTALACLLADCGAFSEAGEFANRALGINPNSPEARIVNALHFSSRGLLDSALVELTRAERANPDHVRVRVERGVVNLGLNRLDEACQDFLWVTERDPDNVRALSGLGESAWRCGRVREAIEAYTRVIDLGEAGPEVFQGRAEALAMAGLREEAAADCARSLELDPLNSDIHAMRGLMNLELGRYDEASRDLNQAIALDGDLVEAIVARGELRDRQGDNAGAVADFAAAVRLNPEDPDLVLRWLRSIGDAGDHMTALRLLEREIRAHPNVLSLALLKGDLLAESGRPEEAEAWYRRVSHQIPNEIEPHLRLAEFHESRSESARALNELDMAIRIDLSDPFPRLMRAALLERLGRSDEAGRELGAASRKRRLREK
jgi:tetratricopeptide (TPR) repeat protein